MADRCLRIRVTWQYGPAYYLHLGVGVVFGRLSLWLANQVGITPTGRRCARIARHHIEMAKLIDAAADQTYIEGGTNG